MVGNNLLTQENLKSCYVYWQFQFQSILNLKNDTLICKGEVEVCFIDNNSGKPKAFPVGLLNLFKN